MEILGCRLDPVDADEAAGGILSLAQEGRGAQIVTLGTEMIVYAQRDARFRAIVNACALSLCDTVGVLLVARRRGAALHARVTGIELTQRLCAGAAARGLPVYLLGGAQGVADAAAAVLRARFPGLIVAGAHSGFFRAEESDAVAAAIARSGARLLFAGMGSPRQEYWLAENLARTGCGVGIGIGGTFDVIAGRVRRAPPLARRFGLEWLYRLVTQPRRWRRQLALPRFVALIACDELRLRSARSGAAGP